MRLTWNSFFPLLITAFGLLLAITIWYTTEPRFETQHIPFDKTRFTFSYSDHQSPLVRITPFSCNIRLLVNDANMNDTLFTRGIDVAWRCAHDPLSINLDPYIGPGKNKIFMFSPGNATPEIRSVHTTGDVVLMAVCIFLYPLAAGGLCLWRQRTDILRAGLRHAPHLALAAVLLAAAVWCRLRLIPFISDDYITFLSGWLGHIRRTGLSGYGQAFSNYSPLYTYFLGLFDLFFPDMQPLYAIKCTTFVGEAFAAFWLYRLCALYYRKRTWVPVLAAPLLLLTPSLLINGATSGQCDIWWTAFLLAALYYLVIDRPVAFLIYCGLAFSFKLQAIFLAPLFLALLLMGRIPWRPIWIPPAVFVASCLPCWLEGRPLLDMLLIYVNEAGKGSLNFNAANLYLLRHFNREWYGTLLAVTLTLIIALVTWRRWQQPRTLPQYVLLATLSAGLMPYVLPHMHDRYFFAADVFGFLLACLRPRWWIVPVLFQSASALAPPPWQSPFLTFIPLWYRLRIGLYLNGAALVVLVLLCLKYVWNKPPGADKLPPDA